MASQVQWQGFLCLAVIAGSAAASLLVIVRQKERRDVVRDNQRETLWMSCWSWVHPAWLLAFRSTAVIALTAVLMWDAWTYDMSIMLYYTEWSMLLVIIYFSIATLVSAHGCLMHSRYQTNEQDSDGISLLCNDHTDQREGTEKRAGPLGSLMYIAYQVCGGAVVLTDVVFWGLIVPFMSSAHFTLNAVMSCMHTLNLVFLLTETALNSLAFPWFRIAYFILWTCSYVIIQWIMHVCGLSWWPYPFLDPTTSWAPLWYFAVVLLHLLCFVVYWLIIRAKTSCFRVLA